MNTLFNNISEVIPTILIMISILVMYIIQYYSTISPSYLEFDSYYNDELKLMRTINKTYDVAFLAVTAIQITGILAHVFTGNTAIMFTMVTLQFTYMLLAILGMYAIAFRQRLYWRRQR